MQETYFINIYYFKEWTGKSDGLYCTQVCPNVSNTILYHKVNSISRKVLPWAVAPPWLDHLFSVAEGLRCPVCGRTKLRGVLRMDEHRTNERLAGRQRFFHFSLSLCCRLSDRWCVREILFVLFSVYSVLPSSKLPSQFWWQNWEMKPKQTC